MSKKKILVIGGGYTGLVAALKLAEQGYAITIIERGNSLGGLASDFKIEGSSLERAYHHLFKTDVHIINLAAELGISDKLVWHNSSVSLYYDGVLYPFKGGLDLIRFKPLNFINRIRAGLIVVYLQKKNDWKIFEKVSAYDWMLKYSGKQVTKVIWEPLLKGKFDTHYDKVSMAWLWARLHIRAQSREKGGEKLGYFDGGFQTFTDALLSELKKYDVTIKKGVEIKSIDSINNKPVIELIDGSKQNYDAALATIPSYVFSKMIEGSKHATKNYLKELRSVEYLGARLLIFSSKQDLSPYYWHNINDIDLPFLVFINHTRLIDKKNYGGYYVYYVATYLPHDHELFNISETELEDVWFPALKKVFPGFDSAKIHEKHHFRFANAQHIVDANYSSRIAKHKTPLHGIYLSNFSQIYPEDRGTNYAVRDGESAAKLIIKHLG